MSLYPSPSYYVVFFHLRRLPFRLTNFCSSDNGDKPIWSTGTTLRSGGDKVVLTVQNDGNAVLYKGEALWGSNSMKNN